MPENGAIAGLVGAIVVLGSQFRLIDGALQSPAYSWLGLMAALLVGPGSPARSSRSAWSAPSPRT